MEDVGRRNLSLRQTFCGIPSGDGGDSDNNSSIGVGAGTAAGGGLGLLAAACGLSNITTLGAIDSDELSYDMTRLLRLFGDQDRANSSNEDGNEQKPKPCSQRIYNTTNRQGK